MKLLIATGFGGMTGGRETYLRAVVPLLRAAGHDLGFALEVPAAVGHPSVTGTDPGPVWNLPEDLPAVAAWRPDVVYLHGLDAPATESALADSYPTVYFPHSYHGTCISGHKCRTRPTATACGRVLGPKCLALYLPLGCGGRNPLTMVQRYRSERRRLAQLSRYRAVVVASRHMRDEFRKHGVPDGKLTVLPLFPTDTARDAAAPAERARSDRVLFVGRVTALKGLSHLIAAVPVASADLGRKLTLVVAGDGPAKEAAEAEARRRGVAAEFLGWVSAERRADEMRRADVLAVPSVWPEPFGLVGIEAGCVGLPAVGYAVGGIPDWLTPGVSGESASGDRPNPTELAAALVRALADASHWHKLRVGAWEAVRRFSAEAHVAKLFTVLDGVANSEHTPRRFA